MPVEIKNLEGLKIFEYEGADLYGADLQGADLRRADLRRASLQGANLQGANLEGANLRRASLRRASLQGASLRGAKIDWQSHELLAEILRQAAGEDIEKRKIAGFILVSPDFCWEAFLKLDDPLTTWALSVFRSYGWEGEGEGEGEH